MPPRSNERGGVVFFLSVLRFDPQQNTSGLKRLFMRFAIICERAAVQRIVDPAFNNISPSLLKC